MRTRVKVNSHIPELFVPIEYGATVVLKPKPVLDKIQEKLSISVPRTNLPRPNLALDNYRGQRVRLLLKDGTVLIGTMDKPQWDFLCLRDVEEISKRGKLYADWIAVRSDSVVRVYPANAAIQRTKD